MNPNQPDNQTLQDMIQVAVSQRDAANNQIIHQAAQIAALQRRIAELEAQAKESEPANDTAPAVNGHAAA